MADILTEAEVRELEDRCADMPPGPWKMSALIRTLRAEQAKLARRDALLREAAPDIPKNWMRMLQEQAAEIIELRKIRRETWAEAAHWVETQHPECVEIVEEFERRAKGEVPDGGR